MSHSILHFIKESFIFGIDLLATGIGKFPEQLLLFGVQLLGSYNFYLDVQITLTSPAHMGHALAFYPEGSPALCSGGYFKIHCTVKGWSLYSVAQGSLDKAYRHLVD